ncbi:MAG: glycosyltransferase family 4 protein [Janthinobacterium lividum]
MLKKLTIFVHRASECLTDHESHGDGLICFSLLNGLAERGHQIFAYTNAASIRNCSPNLHLQTGQRLLPANSLAPWEYAWQADRWMRNLSRQHSLDLIWRMHPYGNGCPTVPQTGGRPLVIGPLFYNWPAQPRTPLKSGRPRFGIGLQSVIGPAAARGWLRTLQQASLILCATGDHAVMMQRQFPEADVVTLPVIIDPPPVEPSRRRAEHVVLMFAGNLVPGKNPMLFCQTIRSLRNSGIDAVGIVLGEGPEQEKLDVYCARFGLNEWISFQGKVDNSEVYGYLSEADFLVSTSFGEPYGRGIVEAMSVGTPAVCHRSGGPSEYIIDGINGLLVDALTGAAFAGSIVRTLSQPGAWKDLSENARRTAQAWRSEIVLPQLEVALYAVIQGSQP